MKAIGIHVFAGGFTIGVKRIMPVECQLETHNFGVETAEEVVGVPVVNDKNANWPNFTGEMAFGNPRCTGFSTITSGYGEETHGAFAKQTCDIQQLCAYAAGRFDVVVWESVQQAFSTGRDLIDWVIREHFKPKHYRIAHVFINAASFGNAQQRKRYFFVAYRDDRNFNITPPHIDPEKTMLYDAIWDLRQRECNEWHLLDLNYDRDSYIKLTPDEKLCVPQLPNGWCMNRFAKYASEMLPKQYKWVWKYRTSDIPFSIHCITRLNWLHPSPTLHSSCVRFIHPDHNRGLTIGELSTIMGWPDIPKGKLPTSQLAKGIVPDVGEWLAQQVVTYLNNGWGAEDWESSFNAHTGEWVGRDTHGELEKIFDMTHYTGHMFDRERFDVKETQKHVIMEKRRHAYVQPHG